MPFYLYKQSPRPDGSVRYTQQRQITLAGSSTGLIYPFVLAYARRQERFAWHAKINDLLDEAGIPPKGHAVVIDLKPKESVTLFELTDVWGYSYPEWTPIAMRMETLFLDEKPLDPDAFKQRFADARCRRRPLYEFLHLQGGTIGGSWNWGQVGTVNGALLPPEALDFFLERLQESLAEPGDTQECDAPTTPR